MKNLIFGIAAGMLLVSPAHAFETGTWEGKNEETTGRLEIKSQGTDYITSLDIYEPSRPGFDMGYCLSDADSKDVNNELQVLSEGEIGFVIKKDGEQLKVIPNLSNTSIPVCGDNPSWSEEDIANIKWKKVQ